MVNHYSLHILFTFWFLVKKKKNENKKKKKTFFLDTVYIINLSMRLSKKLEEKITKKNIFSSVFCYF